MATQTKPDRCRNMHRGGMTVEEIARELRCSLAQVQDWLKPLSEAGPQAHVVGRRMLPAGPVCGCGLVGCRLHGRRA